MRETTINFKAPTVRDVAALAALGRSTFVNTFGHLYAPHDLAAFLNSTFADAAVLRELLDPTLAYYAALAGDTWIGYAKVSACKLPVSNPPAGRRGGELRQLYIQPAWHGKGVAAKLMEWALAELTARGFDDVYLGVWSENHRAQRFYAKHGFVVCGHYQFMVGAHADDETIMRRAL